MGMIVIEGQCVTYQNKRRNTNIQYWSLKTSINIKEKHMV